MLELFKNILWHKKSQNLKNIHFVKTFYVKDHDEPNKMTWGEAMEKFGPNSNDTKCRLPTKFELGIMYRNRDKIPNLSDDWYWSSSEHTSTPAYVEKFSDGTQYDLTKNGSYGVRCVRR